MVAIAGLYRTGKSYLLNRLMGKGAGFTVGPSVKACTKGIWLWGRALPSPDGGGAYHVLFLDTEGLGSTVRGTSYDSRVFALAILLSSAFIYNSTGVIDGDALARLSLVVNLTRHIHVRSSSAEVRLWAGRVCVYVCQSVCTCVSVRVPSPSLSPSPAARRGHGVLLPLPLLPVGRQGLWCETGTRRQTHHLAGLPGGRAQTRGRRQ